jgi:hypothetical protein
MAEGITNIAGIEIPSTDPIFLAVVGVHILLGLACTVTGAIANTRIGLFDAAALGLVALRPE